ncbi:MAG: GtrA family protein [Gammaproteobacteria bacterium]|nr:GtrA family protein [Gammaproteobacteria bacterium]
MAVTSSLLNLVKLVLRFLVSGGIATVVHWATLWGLVSLQINAVIASSIGALVGAVVNYFLQYFFAFKTKRGHKKAVLAYIPSVTVSWLLNLGLFYSLYGTLFSVPMFADPLLAQVATTGVVMVVNFLLYKKVVFREK